MNSQDYETQAMRTAKDMGTTQLNLIHSAMGLSSDAGEFVDAIKKHTIYNKELDITNCIEELGDVLWFVALACKSLNTTLDVVMRANIVKLKIRYPDKYTDQAAQDRADKKEDIVPPAIKAIDPIHGVRYYISPKRMDAMNYLYCSGPYNDREFANSVRTGEQVITCVTPEDPIEYARWLTASRFIPAGAGSKML